MDELDILLFRVHSKSQELGHPYPTRHFIELSSQKRPVSRQSTVDPDPSTFARTPTPCQRNYYLSHRASLLSPLSCSHNLSRA